MQIYGYVEEAKDRIQRLCFVNNVMKYQVP